MKHYVGLDVSMKETSICIVDETGKFVYENLVASDPFEIANCLKKTNLTIEKVALESGSISHWLATQLINQGIPTICVDARHIAAILSVSVNKTDKNDARGIANAIRCGLYREVILKPQKNVDIEILLTARRGLVKQRTALKNTIRGLLKSYGIRLGLITGNKKFINNVRENIKERSSLVRMSIETLLSTFEIVEIQINKLEKELKEITKADADILLLQTIPGVGLITAISFKIAVGDPSRFDDSKDVGAYFGMTPKQYSSGETNKMGRISKCGHSEVRSLLVEAATVMLTRTKLWSKLKAWGLKIYRKKGMKKASVAVGRKLAVIMHRMLITKEPFRLSDKEEMESKKEKIAV
jgi:transposase